MLGGRDVEELVKAIKALGPAGALIAISLYLTYIFASQYTDLHELATTAKAHAVQEAESIRIARKTCRAIHVLAKLDPEGCEER
jgi:hypothetical protein